MDIQIQENELKQLAEDIIQKALQKGATAAETGVNRGTGLSTEIRMGEVDTLEYNQDQSLNMTVYFGQRKGSASTADLSPKAIEETLDAACRIAKYTSEDEFAGLADENLMAKSFPDLDLYHPWDISADDAIKLAIDCETQALNADERITNSDGAYFHTYAGTGVYANSHGFVGATSGSQHNLSCSVIAEADGNMERGYEYDNSRVYGNLKSAKDIGDLAAERTLKRLGGQVIKTQQANVLYSPQMARSIIGHFANAVSGGSLYRKASFLLDSLGETIFPEFINLHEQPYISQAAGSIAYDKEGVATREQHFVKEGVVENYVLGSYSARKLGMQTTANQGGAHNLILDSTGQSFDELLKQMGTGFYLTDLMGSSVNMVTGDYSRGASGFWVENGEIQFPVKEITVAGNLKDMFLNVLAVGADVDNRGGTRTGSILIKDMMIAGK